MTTRHQGLEDSALSVETIPQTIGAGAINGNGVDMNGWDSVMFIAQISGIGNGGTFDMRVVESANANFSGAVNTTNASITQVPNGVTNVCVTIDLFRPGGNRYYRVVATVGTNNVNFGVLAVRRRGQSRAPVAQPANFQYQKVVDGVKVAAS